MRLGGYTLVAGYCATNHAVVGLSTSLRVEAAAAGVRVSVHCPGPVRTQAHIDGGKYGKILRPMPPETLRAIVDRQRPIRPEQFAKQALRAAARNRAIIDIPSSWKVLWWLYRLSPRLGFYLGRKGLEMAKRTMRRVPPEQSGAR